MMFGNELARRNSLILLVVFMPCLAVANEPNEPAQDDSLADLRARIEAVERQNQHLSRQNEYLLRAVTRPESVGADAPGAIQQVGDIEGPLGREDISAESLFRMEQEYQGAQTPYFTQDTVPVGPSQGPVVQGRWGSGFVNNGLWFVTPESDFRLHIGGRTQWDMASFNASDQVQRPLDQGGIGPLRDGTDFRRARLRAEGAMFEQMEFCVEYDFVDSTQAAGTPYNIPSPRDLWWNFSNLPVVGNFRIGNQ